MAELLAKPGVPLVDHLREVLFLGNDLTRRMGLEGRLRAQALLACVLHDIGKATHSFQEHMRAARAFEEAKARGASDRELQQLRQAANQKKAAAYPHALASLPFVLVAEAHLAENTAGIPFAWRLRVLYSLTTRLWGPGSTRAITRRRTSFIPPCRMP